MAADINQYINSMQQRRARQVVRPPSKAARPAMKPAMSVATGNPAIDRPVLDQAVAAAQVEQQMAANQAMLEEARRALAARQALAAGQMSGVVAPQPVGTGMSTMPARPMQQPVAPQPVGSGMSTLPARPATSAQPPIMVGRPARIKVVPRKKK